MSKKTDMPTNIVEFMKVIYKPYKWPIFAVFFFVFAGQVAGNSTAYGFKIIVDRFVENQTFSWEVFMWPVILLLGLYILSSVFARIGQIIQIKIVPDIMKDTQQFIVMNLLRRPTSYFEDTFSGGLNKRIYQVEEGTKFFVDDLPWNVSWMTMSWVVSVFFLFSIHWSLGAIFLTCLVLFTIGSYPLTKRIFILSKDNATRSSELSAYIVDMISNIPMVHSFARRNFEKKLHAKNLDMFIKSERDVWWSDVYTRFFQDFTIIIIVALLTTRSLSLGSAGLITVGDFVLIIGLLPGVIMGIWHLGDTARHIMRKVGEFRDSLQQIEFEVGKERIKESAVSELVPSINFNKVNFSYPTLPGSIFDSFSLEIPKHQKIGVVGISGAGKSTLIKLLLRHYMIDSGEIMIGDRNIESLPIESLRDMIAFVPQDTSLFHRTLEENIKYGNPKATKQEMVEAAKKAYAHDFIGDLKDGYKSFVGERGVKLSGGQRQRIAIARAILKNAPILVLDEATSSLDTESEIFIQKALREAMEGSTVIAIAHRLSTLREMDRIVVLEGGKVVEDGTPDELLENKDGVFATMWDSQKGGFIS